jgi:hypothetical protein
MNLDGYIDVTTRLAKALALFPDLRITETNPKVVTVDNARFVEVTCTVWRSTDDPIPVRASAWEPIPGASAFTRNSEMMNASTSALGRALGFLGMGIGKSIASADEVSYRTSETARTGPAREAGSRPSPTMEADPEGAIPRPRLVDGPRPASEKQRGFIRKLLTERDYTLDDGIVIDDLDVAAAHELIELLKSIEPVR